MATKYGKKSTTKIPTGILGRLAKGPRIDSVINVQYSFLPLHDWDLQPRYSTLQCYDGQPTYANRLFSTKMVQWPECDARENPREFNIEKLRIILLLEADFNANNKWLGQVVMLNAESLNLLAEERYSSHRNKAAVLQCLNKGQFYDLLHQWKHPAALCSNDTKSCYDHITLLATALCLCWLVPQSQQYRAC